jgi:hypothetical protein
MQERGPEPEPRAAILSMRTIALSWETWRAVIAVLREKGLPYMLEHANVIEELLERHAPISWRDCWDRDDSSRSVRF